jgi:antirestriction protein ArdC
MITSEARRPLPTFRQWLENQSPGTQPPDFEAFADLAARTQDQSLDHLTEDAASFGRMWMGACVAAVELCNMEALKHGRSAEQVVATLPRVFACAAMYAVASIVTDDANFRSIAKVLTEEFRAAAKAAADQLIEKQRS